MQGACSKSGCILSYFRFFFFNFQRVDLSSSRVWAVHTVLALVPWCALILVSLPQKGCGYHLDLFMVAVMLGVCSVMGLPWFVAATVLSITHVNSLKLESGCSAPGEQPRFLGIREQRVTGLMIFVLMGCSVFLTTVLKVGGKCKTPNSLDFLFLFFWRLYKTKTSPFSLGLGSCGVQEEVILNLGACPMVGTSSH